MSDEKKDELRVRRVRSLDIGGQALVDFFSDREKAFGVIADELPPGTEYVGVTPHPMKRGTFCLLVRNEAFEPVKDNDPIPEHPAIMIKIYPREGAS